MFKIESYVTPILLSYVDKYVRDFKPADAQVSLWGGGVVLHNLVLKADVLQQEVALPFTLVSGRIHELLIQVPWTKIMSDPIVVTIDTIECIFSPDPPTASEENVQQNPPSKAQVVEAPPGYMQALVRRIVSNISLRVHHLIVKYVQDDVVLSLNVKHLSVDSAGPDWEAAFADIDQSEPLIRRLVRLDDLTLCLDRADSDGKIRYYQEPLLYRCQLDLRVWTRLVSASTRRASNLSVQLRSSKLAWGVTNEQLTLLIRLLRERSQMQARSPPPPPKQATTVSPPPHTSSNNAEPVRTGSWSEWAWSWLPSWGARPGVEEAAQAAAPTPVYCSAYLDHVSLVFKMMETDGSNRKRARGVLEVRASHAAARAASCAPTALRVRAGLRSLRVQSHGRCVCGRQDVNTGAEDFTVYLDKKDYEEETEPWTWPQEVFEDKIELAEEAEEQDLPDEVQSETQVPTVSEQPVSTQLQSTINVQVATVQTNLQTQNVGPSKEPERTNVVEDKPKDDDIWHLLKPIIYFEYTHVRSPPNTFTNPYDDPPSDFQFSDWEEDSRMKISILPLDVRLTIGLIHRLSVLRNILQDLPSVPVQDIPAKTLTVEECEALNENLPQRRITMEVEGFRVRMVPWDHSLSERQQIIPIYLDIEVPHAKLIVSGALYAHRVCSAACQLPKDEGPLWQGARMHVSATLAAVAVTLSSRVDAAQRPVARADLRCVAHLLQHPAMFRRRDSVTHSYNVKIHEINACGSAARMHAAWQVVESLVLQHSSLPLRHTTLAKDALSDEEAVAIDASLEDITLRGFVTKHTNTHNCMIQTARVMAFYASKDGPLKQAWLFSAPNTPTPTPFLRIAGQLGEEDFEESLDYLGCWMAPMAASIDPLLIAWLAYKPQLKPAMSDILIPGVKSSSLSYLRRRTTPPSSSGRGGSRTGSGSELIHSARPRSTGSSSDQRPTAAPQPAKTSDAAPVPEAVLRLHERLQRMLINVEMAHTVVYHAVTSASALDCGSLTDAMERHAATAHHVLAISVGFITLTSNATLKYLWNEVKNDGPTFRTEPAAKPKKHGSMEQAESFPWKLCLSEVTCYTLEASEMIDPARERPFGMRSQLKNTGSVNTRIVLEPVTTTVTLSVVTKTMQIRTWVKPQEQPHKVAGPTTDELRVKYFTTGTDFKPSTLKEFVRGPAKRRKPSSEGPPKEFKSHELTEKTTMGPVVSIGIHLHADTPPVMVKLEHDQVHTVAAAVHCLNHLHILMNRAPIVVGRQNLSSGSLRSVSELDELQTASDENVSETHSDLVPILEYHAVPLVKLKKFLWFQWVMGGATLVISSHQVKLAFAADDIICTIDLQEHYDQLKMKIASASVRHHQKNSNEEWAAGVLGGRVLEAREPINGMEENHFLSITITQAQISNLPDSWKEELHPKLLQQKSSSDNMWEIYATLAPLEAVIQPAVLENILTLFQQMEPPSFCPLNTEVLQSDTWQWPFCYVSAGGLRLLITTERRNDIDEDTFLLNVGKISINPYPENPICRRSVSAIDGGWSAGGIEGHQYEVFVQSVAIQSTVFSQIAQDEANQLHTTGSENPAVKWTQPDTAPIVTTILHPVEVNLVLAPALYYNKVLACGAAIELNLTSDCSIEMSLEQLKLMHQIIADAKEALVLSIESCITLETTAHHVCPYALIFKQDTEPDDLADVSVTTVNEDNPSNQMLGCDRSFAADSGVDMNMSKYSVNPLESAITTKKTVSIALDEEKSDSSDYVEVFVMMGIIDISLYVGDDDSSEVIALRPPWSPSTTQTKLTEPTTDLDGDGPNMNLEPKTSSGNVSRSLTETVRHADVGHTKLDLNKFVRRYEGTVPLFHVTLYQPNFYYWKKKTQSNIQVSLFNARMCLGSRPDPGAWSAQLISTAKGESDPVTDIPPALATVKIVIPINASGMANTLPNPVTTKGTVQVDIERPVLIELSADRLRRLKLIAGLIGNRLRQDEDDDLDLDVEEDVDLPPLYRLRRFMVDRSVESITIEMSQLGVSGFDGTVGWDSASLQIAAGLRPERLSARGLVTALLVAAGPPTDCRHVIMQPLMLGMELVSTWEAWRRVEGGMLAKEPSVHMTVDLDRVTFDVRPSDLATLSRMQRILKKIFGTKRSSAATENSVDSIFSSGTEENLLKPPNVTKGTSATSIGSGELEDHYYKDDLKSGAFKIITGPQLPMAYQVTLHGNTVSWRYPHPRTITRMTLFPIPGVYEEVNCVLELYSFLLKRWMAHTRFKLPVLEPREYKLFVAPPDAVFAMMWRVRVLADNEEQMPFEFKVEHYMPREDPLLIDRVSEAPFTEEGVTAEQLSSALRVDSYFAPRLFPRLRLTLRFVEFELNAHNALPYLSSQATALEGYYVSRPLMRAHRVLSIVASDFAAHAHLGSGAGQLLLLDTKLSCDVMECTTGALQQAMSKTRFRVAASASGAQGPRVRAFLEPVRVALHVPRLRTLGALADDWTLAFEQYREDTRSSVGSEEVGRSQLRSKAAVQEATAAALEGRVSLWLHNSCASALRVGQEGTDEIVPLGPGARLAYRWRFPSAPLRLRFALASPSADWHWSTSIPFTPGVNRVRLADAEELGSAQTPGGGVFLHASVEARGAHRALSLAGRLVLANVLRRPLLYKVRARCADGKVWRSVCSGELFAESVGRSVLCGADCDMVLKIKFASQETGWSGDIPLKECPKENVPWLVKVPSVGDTAYESVWCRVVRARSDGRVLAAVWPLYVLYSHLPLDTDMLVVTETELSTPDLATPCSRPPPLVQATPGRGACTHLLAPGTTAARHQLSFQYKDIECPVTREAIPLHYGVTDTSVFDKRAPVNNIEDVVADIRAWFDRSGHAVSSSWPYSVVASHLYGEWQPAKLQPRCDVTVRYGAVRAGGGCSLEIQLCPVVLLCNAAPLALTLRAHDAAPLCKVESGAAISAPSAVLRKPFFMSVEIGRETFVSSQLQVWSEEPGRYGAPPRGCVALDHAAPFAIHCNHKVALLTLYYEIKEEINVLGVTTTFMVINRLNSSLLVSAIAMPFAEADTEPILQPKSFKVVPQTKEGTMEGEPLPRFYVPGRWRGTDPGELRAFLCLALPAGAYPAHTPAPVRLGLPPFRRAVHLLDEHNASMAVVVLQQKHEGRWIVTVAPDPCPQFVVHNRTSQHLAVAEPLRLADDDYGAPQRTQVVSECNGARWWCKVAAGAVVHYSTPTHNMRFPPSATAPTPEDIPYIVIGNTEGVEEPDWGTGAAAAGGEQLLQLPGGGTVKLRVHPHPHSTLLELQDVDEHDISASDIRRRIQGFSLSQHSIPLHRRDTGSTVRRKSIAKHVDSLISKEGEGNLITTSSNMASKETQTKIRLQILPEKVEPIVEKPEDSQPTNALPEKTVQIDTLTDKPVNSGTVPDKPVNSGAVPDKPVNSGAVPDKPAKSDAVPDKRVNSDAVPDKPVNSGAVPDKPAKSDAVPDKRVNSDAVPDKPVNSGAVPDKPVQFSEDKTEPDDGLDRLSKTKKSENLLQTETSKTSNVNDAKTTETLAEEPEPHEGPNVEGVSYYKPSSTTEDVDGSTKKPSIFDNVPDSDWDNNDRWSSTERLRCVFSGIAIEMAEASDIAPLFALHIDRAAVVVQLDHRGTRGVLSIADVQVDNLQYDSGQYDFGVVASTRAAPLERDACPPLWSALAAGDALDPRPDDARLLLRLRRDRWRVAGATFSEFSEVEVSLGPLALYAEDSYATALARLARALRAPPGAPPALAEARALQHPLRLRALHVHPLDLTLTLHTAVRMYIALDQSPLRLSAFKLQDMMTSAEHLTHALTVHYLSAAILGAGWVVGGLELLGAPGALAARVGGATGGVRGVAAAAAAALLRSLSAWAGSLARNLDLLAGDEEHARRAAAARRRPPASLVAGLAAGITNFAINLLGAVGGLAHHPLVGVAVGETESGAMALRRGLLGALAKPLSATADLVAFAGTGLLRQTGWDPVPQPRTRHGELEEASAGWRRDCVRWAFRLAELSALAGYDVLLDGAPLRLLLSHKFLVVADPETERIVEMIDFRFCTLGPYKGSIVELMVTQRRQKEKVAEARAVDEDDEYQISAAAMARVARYTGAGGAGSEARVLALLPPPRRSAALHAALAAAVHANDDSHLRLL